MFSGLMGKHFLPKRSISWSLLWYFHVLRGSK